MQTPDPLAGFCLSVNPSETQITQSTVVASSNQAPNATLTDANKELETTVKTNLALLRLLVHEPVKIYPLYASDQGLSMYEMFMKRHPLAWSAFFMGAEREIRHACQMVSQESTSNGKAIFPFAPNVLRAFYLTPLFMLKAVILGQDPYPGMSKKGMPKAIGVCFASDRLSGEIPDSLKTVYGELERTVENWKQPGHADITSWGKQGVLLINTALTVEANRPGSHTGYWKPFTEKLMDYINENCRDVVFMLWGKHAQKAAETIYSSRHLKLTAYHPSPMNAGREEFQFKGCDHFNLANFHLQDKGIRPIDWTV